MIVKMQHALAGDRFSFRPGQIVKCPDVVGQRLVDHGIAKELPKATDDMVEEHFDDSPPPMRKAPPEKADARKPETPETGAPAATCKGATAKGNPCKKAPLPGSEFCKKHQEG